LEKAAVWLVRMAAFSCADGPAAKSALHLISITTLGLSLRSDAGSDKEWFR